MRRWCVSPGLLKVSCSILASIAIGAFACSEDPISSGAQGGGGSAGARASGGASGNGGLGGLIVSNSGSGGRAPFGSASPPDVRCSELSAAGASGDDGAGGVPAYGGAADESGGGEGGAAVWDDTCALPPSRCIDEETLVYFMSGICVRGRCQWQTFELGCGSLCFQGGCLGSSTAN